MTPVRHLLCEQSRLSCVMTVPQRCRTAAVGWKPPLAFVLDDKLMEWLMVSLIDGIIETGKGTATEY